MQNLGFSDRNADRSARVLVKLQRPPPEMRIFSPAALPCSITRTRRPRRPASIAHIIPAAPAPITTTSYRSNAVLPGPASSIARGARSCSAPDDSPAWIAMAWTRLYDQDEPQRVNRWLAQNGVCSRREAEALIAQGLVTIDGAP